MLPALRACARPPPLLRRPRARAFSAPPPPPRGLALEHAHFESRTLPYPRAHVYGVVADVASYEKFVPWCVGSRVLSSGGWAPGAAQQRLQAELVVGFRLLHERYTSDVTLRPGAAVVAEARDTQLFRRLRNEWTFADAAGAGGGQHTALTFSVDFAFHSRLYAATASLFFDEVVLRMVSAFEARCAETWKGAPQPQLLRRPTLMPQQPQQLQQSQTQQPQQLQQLQPQQLQLQQLQQLQPPPPPPQRRGPSSAPPLPASQRSLW